MTPEQRLDRLERVAKLFVAAGLRAREQSREQHDRINILITMHNKNEDQWRAKSEELDGRINILIQTQMDTHEQIKQTNEQIKETHEQIRETNEQIRDLATSQAELSRSQKITDQTLRAFIDSLRKGGNGNSSG